jgi:hypothetical protein
MAMRPFVIGTVVGWITLLALGFLAYGVLLPDFFEANAGSAAGTERDPPLYWAVLLGEFGLAAAVTIAIGRWAKIVGPAAGLQIGATLGFLMAVAYDFMGYGTMNVANLTATVADVAIATARTGIGGAVVGTVLATTSSSSRR